MKPYRFSVVIFICLISCNNSYQANKPNSDIKATAIMSNKKTIEESIIVEPEKKNSGKSVSQEIRKVDFDNFTFQWCQSDLYTNSIIKLHNGELDTIRIRKKGKFEEPVAFWIERIIYTDITNDGKEDALVVINASAYPGSGFGCTYLFAENGSKLQTLWSAEYGDKWENGLRTLSINDNQITLERFTHIDKGNDSEPNTLMANYFIRIIYYWNGVKIIKRSETLIPNEIGNHNFRGYFLNGVEGTKGKVMD